jgi:hypothetical protein
MKNISLFASSLLIGLFTLSSCINNDKSKTTSEIEVKVIASDKPEYFNLRPKLEKDYGYTYDDVYAENIYTTNMQDFIKVSGFRNSIYKKQFPTGTWLEVKGLALKGQLIEIDMEAHKSK